MLVEVVEEVWIVGVCSCAGSSEKRREMDCARRERRGEEEEESWWRRSCVCRDRK